MKKYKLIDLNFQDYNYLIYLDIIYDYKYKLTMFYI